MSSEKAWTPEEREESLREDAVRQALQGPGRYWRDVHDEEGAFIGRVPPVPVDDERMAWARSAIVRTLGSVMRSEPEMAEQLGRRFTRGQPTAGAEVLLKGVKLRYDERGDALVILLGPPEDRTATQIPGSALRQGPPELS